jgi:hypothetical protein
MGGLELREVRTGRARRLGLRSTGKRERQKACCCEKAAGTVEANSCSHQLFGAVSGYQDLEAACLRREKPFLPSCVERMKVQEGFA